MDNLTVEVIIRNPECIDGKLKKSNFVAVQNLTKLIITKQNLRTLARRVFDDLRLMDSIDLSSNLIENLPGDLFDMNIKLEDINLSKNLIKTINCDLFSKVLDLKQLNLSFNRINKLDENCFYSISLIELDLSFNSLIEIHQNSFRFLINLQTLKLNNNFLIDIKLCLHNLTVLYLNNNLLTNFDFKLINLRALYLMDNCLMDFKIWSPIENLIVLDLLNNDLESLMAINQFANVPNLRFLSLKIVREFELKSIENLIYLQLFKLIYAGQIFDWAGYKLSDYFRKMLNFQNLILIVDNFTIDYFNRLNNLKNLTMLYVECTKPNLNRYHNLDLNKILKGLNNLDSASFKNLNGYKLKKSKVLVRMESKLKNLSITGLRNVSLSNQFTNFKLLTNLSIVHNNIEMIGTFTWRNLQYLHTLNLEYSKFRKIKKSFFRFSMLLEFLNLSNCQIDSIENHSFMHLIRLKILNLLHNPLRNIQSDAFIGLEERRCQILI